MSNTNTPSNTTPGQGTTPTHAIPLSPEEEEEEEGEEEEEDDHPFSVFQDFDSESEGGMQLDPPPPLPEFTNTELDQEVQAWRELRDATLFSTVAPDPSTHGLDHLSKGGERERGRVARARHRLREEEYAALAVLDDWELLVSYAVKNGLTIPQARRRFTAKLLAPENPVLEDELYGARFVIPASRSELLPSFLDGGNGNGARQPELATGTGNATAYLVPGTWKEVLTDEEDGWWGIGRGPKARKVSRERERNGGSRRVVSGMSSSV